METSVVDERANNQKVESGFRMQKSNQTTKVVCVSTFSRTDLLQECLYSIVKARNIENLLLLVVQQGNKPEVSEIISQFSQNIDVLIRISGEGKTPLQNINYNRILCYEYSFEILGAEYVLAVEDDCKISEDSFLFVDSVVSTHNSKKFFRGVNLGSKELDCATNTYSCLRFGLMGQAGVITRKTWSHFNLKKIKALAESIPFDAIVEPYLKSGYMVTPNRSRMIDRGWNGTHFNTSSADPHFQALSLSWVDNSSHLPTTDFQKNNMIHSWRKDSRVFEFKHQPEYWLRLVIANLRIHPHGLIMLNQIRRFIGKAKYS